MHKAGWDPKDEDAPLVGSKGAPRSEVLRELLFDGLHFTDDGYALMFDELVKVIEESYPEEDAREITYGISRLDAGDGSDSNVRLAPRVG